MTSNLGNYGVELVKSYLEEDGLTAYLPTDKYAPKDIIYLCPTTGNLEIVEVKTKQMRVSYPDTGYNASTIENDRKRMELYRHNFRLYFVDADAECIYRIWLKEALKTRKIFWRGSYITYPKKERNAWGRLEIYFPVEIMEIWKYLKRDEKEKLLSLSKRSSKYKKNILTIKELGKNYAVEQSEFDW